MQARSLCLLSTWLALATAGGCASHPPARAAPLTRLDVGELAPEEVRRRVADQLSEILLPTPRPSTGAPSSDRPLTDLWFWTRPHATRTPGLCAASRVIVDLDPAGAGAGRSAPMRAAGVRSSHRYRFLEAPAQSSPPRLPDETWARADQRCRGLDPHRTLFFDARDEALATEGMWLLGKVLDEARGGRPGFKVSCSAPRLLSDGECLGLLAGVRPDQTWQIRRCDPFTGEAPPTYCRVVETDSELAVRIFVGGMAPGDPVERVEVTQYIPFTPEPAG